MNFDTTCSNPASGGTVTASGMAAIHLACQLLNPGDLVIGADSHTCTYGAVGALSTGVGSTDLAATMVMGENWFRVPGTIRVIYEGKLHST